MYTLIIQDEDVYPYNSRWKTLLIQDEDAYLLIKEEDAYPSN